MKNAFEYEAELAALREELAIWKTKACEAAERETDGLQRLADAERQEPVAVPILDRHTINAWMLECGRQNSALRQADLPNVAGVLKLALDKVKELNQ